MTKFAKWKLAKFHKISRNIIPQNIVDNYMAYNLWKFKIEGIKIEAWQTHETEEFLRNKNIRSDFNFLASDLKYSQIVDNYMV